MLAANQPAEVQAAEIAEISDGTLAQEVGAGNATRSGRQSPGTRNRAAGGIHSPGLGASAAATADAARLAVGDSHGRGESDDEVIDGATSASELLSMYRHMALARALDERIWLLTREGTIPFAVSGAGHEAAQVGLAMALRPGIDYCYAYYRDVALALALGLTPTDIMLSAFARAADCSSGGRQMPNHFSSRSLRIVSASSPVGTQFPQAAGTAWALRLRGEDAVVVVTCGEGATSQGDFHEGLNLAAIHYLPVIFFCQNNGWAISVPERLQAASPGIAARAAGYGIPGVRLDGTDPVSCYQASSAAVARARQGLGPTLIEARVLRLKPHTSTDDDRTYRSAEDLAAMRAADPLPSFRRRVIAAGAGGEEELTRIDRAIAVEVEAAMAAAEAAPEPSPETLWDHVYAVRPASSGGSTPWRN